VSELIKIVFFDVDDTLYDHRYHIQKAITSLREEYAFLQGHSVEYLISLSHRFLEEVHVSLLRGELSYEESRKLRWEKFTAALDHPTSNAMEIADFYSGKYFASERAVPGSIELLKKLKEHYRLGVISNNLFSEQTKKMQRIGIIDYFDTIAISEEVGFAKPDPRIFEVALERARVAASEAVLIGDSWTNDILGALNAGIRPIWFNRLGVISPNPQITEISSLEPAEDILAHIRSDSPTPAITKAEPANV
jgi:putative hydrolase of the HAD superfamily